MIEELLKGKPAPYGNTLVIAKLRRSPFKNYIYGAANTGKWICEFLEENGIKVSGFFVDNKYLKEKTSYI